MLGARCEMQSQPHPPDRPASLPGRLPDFVIIGAAKAGTTSLAYYLEAHPEVFMAPQKELDFFGRFYGRGADWYAQYFAAAGEDVVAGEATPSYLFDERVPDRMREVVPDVRLLAVLRHPIDRAYSHYWHRQALGREARSFEDAVLGELAGGDGFAYLAPGRYAPQLDRYAARFGRDALLVLLFDDLVSDPGAAFARACRFLGVDDSFEPENLGSVFNRSHGYRSMWLRAQMFRFGIFDRLPPRAARALDRLNHRPIEYPALDDRLRARLVDSFEADNAALGAWLGADLASWSR